METIFVTIAETSILVRLGLTAIMNKLGYPFSIREITTEERLINKLRKEHKEILIICRSFLDKCSDETISLIQLNQKKVLRVLINDNHLDSRPLPGFDVIIEPEDIEKTILRKFEKLFLALSTPVHTSGSTGEISDREKDVLRLVAFGMTNKEIAEKLFISSHTVITHRKNITAKLGIKTIAGLTVYAVINKLITPEEIK